MVQEPPLHAVMAPLFCTGASPVRWTGRRFLDPAQVVSQGLKVRPGRALAFFRAL